MLILRHFKFVCNTAALSVYFSIEDSSLFTDVKWIIGNRYFTVFFSTLYIQSVNFHCIFLYTGHKRCDFSLNFPLHLEYNLWIFTIIFSTLYIRCVNFHCIYSILSIKYVYFHCSFIYTGHTIPEFTKWKRCDLRHGNRITTPMSSEIWTSDY